MGLLLVHSRLVTMSEKEKMEKSKQAQSKILPKDGQVVLAIMKEMGITEYEPKTIVQLTEFVYRYATSIMQEARMYANNTTKKSLGVDDIKLAIQLTAESTFTTPPPREVVLECASVKNYSALPTVKPHCGLRLPPDRYCLSSCNFTLKSAQKKPPPKSSFMSGKFFILFTLKFKLFNVFNFFRSWFENVDQIKYQFCQEAESYSSKAECHNSKTYNENRFCTHSFKT